MRMCLPAAMFLVVAAIGSVVLSGCSNQSTPPAASPSTNGTANWQAGFDEALIAGLSELADADRSAAIAQKTCPVSDKPLGAMGKPLKVTVDDREVYLCCPGCEDALLANPEEFFSKLDKS